MYGLEITVRFGLTSSDIVREVSWSKSLTQRWQVTAKISPWHPWSWETSRSISNGWLGPNFNCPTPYCYPNHLLWPIGWFVRVRPQYFDSDTDSGSRCRRVRVSNRRHTPVCWGCIPGPNTQIRTKDFFEIGSNKNSCNDSKTAAVDIPMFHIYAKCNFGENIALLKEITTLEIWRKDDSL